MFGACYLIGTVIGCLTLARMGDIYGRKPIMLIGVIMIVIVTFLLLLSRSYIFDYVLIMTIGIAITG